MEGVRRAQGTSDYRVVDLGTEKPIGSPVIRREPDRMVRDASVPRADVPREAEDPGVVVRKKPAVDVPKTDYALVPEFPGAIGEYAFDRAAYEKAKGEGDPDALFRAIGELDDDGVRAFAASLGANADLSARTDLRASEHLPAFVRALELKLSGDRSPALQSIRVSDVQAVADRIFEEAGRVADDIDREWLFRLCAAAGVPLDRVRFGGKTLSPQWLANRTWSDDVAERDAGAQYLAYIFQRTGVPLDSVFFGEPKPDGYALINKSGRPKFAPGADPRPVIWKNGAPNWPRGVPFTTDRSAPLTSHAVVYRGRAYVDREGRPEVQPNGKPYLLEEPVVVQGGWLSHYRVTTPPAWTAAFEGREIHPVIAEAPLPLGRKRLPKDLGSDAESIRSWFGDEPFRKIAELADADLLMAVLFFQREGYQSASASIEESIARIRVAARIYEIQRDEGFEACLGRSVSDELAAQLAEEVKAPPIDFHQLAAGLPDDPYAAAALKRLANATGTPYAEIPWYVDGGSFGTVTLENAVSPEPMHPTSRFRDPARYHIILDRIEAEFPPQVAEEIRALTNKLEARYLEMSRGPRRVGYDIHCPRPDAKLGKAANIQFVGESGAGKTSLRDLTMDLLIASGAAPKGKAIIHFDGLRAGLAAVNKNGVTVPVDLHEIQPDGSVVTKLAEEIPYTQLASKLRGFVIGFEEVGSAAPMRHRTKEEETIGRAFCSLAMQLADSSGPVLMDGYDVTGLKEMNVGMVSRFRQVTVPSPDGASRARAIDDLCFEEAAKRSLSSIKVTAEGKKWLVDKLAKDGAEGHYRTLGEILNRAIDAAVAKLPGNTTAIELDKRDLIGTPVRAESINAFKRELQESDPPLFGLEDQIRHAEHILRVLAQQKTAGEDPKAKVIFETPAGTGLDLVAHTFAEHLTKIGLADGKYVVLDPSVKSSYQAVTEQDARRAFLSEGLSVLLDTRNWPVQFQETSSGEKVDPLELVRRELRGHLQNGTLKCHLTLLGSRADLKDFMHDFDGERIPFQATVTTSRIKDRSNHDYARDFGHLDNRALLDYLHYYLDAAGVQLEDGLFRSADGRLAKFFSEQKKLPGFPNQVFVRTLVERAQIMAAAGLFDNPDGPPALLGTKELGVLLGELSPARGTGVKDWLAIHWRGARSWMGGGARRVQLAVLNKETQAMRETELQRITLLLQDIARLRIGTGELNTAQVRKKVLEREWAVQMLQDYHFPSVDRMEGSEIEDAFIELGNRFKEQLETISRLPRNEVEEEEKRRKKEHKDNIKAQRNIASSNRAIARSNRALARGMRGQK